MVVLPRGAYRNAPNCLMVIRKTDGHPGQQLRVSINRKENHTTSNASHSRIKTIEYLKVGIINNKRRPSGRGRAYILKRMNCDGGRSDHKVRYPKSQLKKKKNATRKRRPAHRESGSRKHNSSDDDKIKEPKTRKGGIEVTTIVKGLPPSKM